MYRKIFASPSLIDGELILHGHGVGGLAFFPSLAKHAGKSQIAHFQSEHPKGSMVNLDKTLKIPARLHPVLPATLRWCRVSKSGEGLPHQRRKLRPPTGKWGSWSCPSVLRHHRLGPFTTTSQQLPCNEQLCEDSAPQLHDHPL